MTRRIDFVDAPEAAQVDFGHYQTECSVFDVPGQTWGAWWARYGADYIDSDTWWLDDQPVGENAAEEPGHDRHPASGSSAVQIVPGCAHGSAAVPCTPERPPGQRSLRNDIARGLGESLVFPALPPNRAIAIHRLTLEAAGIALECAANWLLVFGPQALIDEVGL